MKTVLTALLVVVSIAAAPAQTFIPRIGLSVFKLTGENAVQGAKGTSLTSLIVGLGYQIPLNDRFSLQPELNFTRKGAVADADNFVIIVTGVTGTFKVIIDYLEVPILAKATFGNSSTKFFVHAGPCVGYGVGGRVKYDFTANDPLIGHQKGQYGVTFGEQPEYYQGTNFYFDNRLDFGIQGGGGVLIADKVFIDIRYSLGLTDVMDDEDSKNRGFIFTVGMPFQLKK